MEDDVASPARQLVTGLHVEAQVITYTVPFCLLANIAHCGKSPVY